MEAVGVFRELQSLLRRALLSETEVSRMSQLVIACDIRGAETLCESWQKEQPSERGFERLLVSIRKGGHLNETYEKLSP